MKFNLQANWDVSDYVTKPIIYGYVIFESDNWPAKLRNKDFKPFEPNGINDVRFLPYRSGDGEYYGGYFHSRNDGWTPGYVSTQNVVYYNTNYTLKQFKENNSGIKYNIIQY